MKRRVISSNNGRSSHEVVIVEESSEPLGHKLLNSHAVHKNSSLDLVELAQEIQKADSFVRATTFNKLKVIAEQMRFLKQQAESVLLEAERNSHLHHAACNLKKVPGNIYHLYKRSSGQQFFSIISPEEWGMELSHEYRGSFRLKQDMSWTPVDDVNPSEIKNNLLLLQRVLKKEHVTSGDESEKMMLG